MGKVRSWLMFLSVLVGMGILAVGAFVVLLGGDFIASSEREPNPAELEKWIGVKVPARATAYRSYAEGFQDWMILARFELPPSELAPFLEANRLEPGERDADSAVQAPLEQAWFHPGAQAQTHAPARLPEGHPDKKPGPDAADLTTVWTESSGDRLIVHVRSITM